MLGSCGLLGLELSGATPFSLIARLPASPRPRNRRPNEPVSDARPRLEGGDQSREPESRFREGNRVHRRSRTGPDLQWTYDLGTEVWVEGAGKGRAPGTRPAEVEEVTTGVKGKGVAPATTLPVPKTGS